MIIDLISELLSHLRLVNFGYCGLRVIVKETGEPVLDDPDFGFGCRPGWNHVYVARNGFGKLYIAKRDRKYSTDDYLGAVMVKADHTINWFHAKESKMTLGDFHG